MANFNAALRQIRRVRRQREAAETGEFERVAPAYRAILEATADLGGDPAFDDLKAWLIETTEARARLPTPEEARRRARVVCERHGVDVPRSSPLFE